MIEIFFSTISIVILFLLIIDIKTCVLFCTAYTFLIPFNNFIVGNIILPFSFILILVFFRFLLYAKQKQLQLNIKPLYPFIFLYLCLGIIILFQDQVPTTYMLSHYRGDIVYFFTLPYVTWNLLQNDKSFRKKIQNTLIVIILISCIYGILLTLVPGTNPYLLVTLPLSGNEFNDLYASSDSGRIFGRISSVFAHPMNFGIFLSLVSVYAYNIRKNIPKILFIILITIILLNALLHGVRSTIITIFATTCYFLYKHKNFKLILTTCIIFSIIALIISQNQALSDYVLSITDINSKKTAVTGSSLDMRIEQLNGAIKEINNSQLVGKGYAYNLYYYETQGNHPVLLAFESLIFVVLCNYGYIGVVIYILTVFLYFRNLSKYINDINGKIILQCLYICFLIYTLFTGLGSYMKYFMIIYITIYSTYFSNSTKKHKIYRKL